MWDVRGSEIMSMIESQSERPRCPENSDKKRVNGSEIIYNLIHKPRISREW